MYPNQSQNTFLNFFKGNEKMALIVVGVSIVFIIIITTIIRMNTAMQPTETNVSLTPTQTIGATAIPVQNGPNVSFQEKAIIEEQIRPQLTNKISISYNVAKIKTYEDDWAIMEVTASQTDPAHIIIRKQTEKWIVVLGPGTYFEETALRNVGAPESLISEVNELL